MVKMMRFKFLFVALCIAIFSTAVQAQPGWKWPAAPKESVAKEKWTVFSDDVKAKNFKAARDPLSWLLKEAADLNKALYQDGSKVYEGLANTEQDAKLKIVYQDSAMLMYDLRTKYFNDEANVLNRKGAIALTYWLNRPEKQGELFDLYQRVIELNKEAVFAINVQNYMFMACTMKTANQKGIDDEKVVGIHEKLTEIVDKNIAKNDNQKAAWEKAKEDINARLESCVKFDCDLVKKQLEPKYRANPKDTIIANKIVGGMARGKCTDDPLFFEVYKVLAEIAPNYQRCATVGKILKTKGDDAGFIDWMNKAFKYGGTSADKANLYLAVAQDQAQKGNSSAARKTALEAVGIDASVAGKAYSFIATLYMNSAGSCKGSDPSNPCHAKAVFIAAYNWYAKAGDQGGMARARAYYPTREEIFTHSMGGQAVNVGCWIGETVTIPGL
jgi:hypothetical protein